MNYTLLPLSRELELKREYRVRAAAVLACMLSGAVAIGVICLLPALARSGFSRTAAENAAASVIARNGRSGLAAAEAELSTANAMLAALGPRLDQPDFTAMIEQIASRRGLSSITSFILRRSSASTVSVVISGTAPTRNDLLSFKAALETMDSGISIDLPLSELAAGSDVPYSMTVSLPVSSSSPPAGPQ